MNKRTKLILSVLGAGAIIVPLVLLVTFSARTPSTPQVSSEKRDIDTRGVEEVAKRAVPEQSPVVLPTPSPSTESASPASPTPSPSPASDEGALEE